MDLQQQAANDLAHALLQHHVGAALASRADGYVVSVQGHPEASVHFGYHQLGGLLVQFYFDGRPPERWDYLPTPAGAASLAEYVVGKIAGVGGGSAAR